MDNTVSNSKEMQDSFIATTLERLKQKHLQELEKDLEFRADIIKSGLSFRYFRNNKDFKRTSLNHGGVICIGYKVIANDSRGCKFLFCVAFCSPTDHFSRYEAKKHILERYMKQEVLSVHIDFADIIEFETIIKSIWNSHKLPLEQLGIKPIIPGRVVELKPWMKYIR